MTPGSIYRMENDARLHLTLMFAVYNSIWFYHKLSYFHHGDDKYVKSVKNLNSMPAEFSFVSLYFQTEFERRRKFIPGVSEKMTVTFIVLHFEKAWGVKKNVWWWYTTQVLN